MKRLLIILGLAVVVGSACTKPAPTPKPITDGLPQDKSSASGTIELLFFDERIPTETPTLPTLRLRTHVKVVEGGIMSFEDAEAIFTAPDGTETHLTAGAGEYDQTAKRISLTGGITLTAESLEIRLEDMQWDNDSQAARSEKPVVLRQGNSELRADTFVFYPRGDDTEAGQEVLVLFNVQGQIDLSPSPTSPEENAPAASEKSTPEPVNMNFNRMTLSKAPELRLLNRRLHAITGGVVVDLQSENEPPAKMEATQVTFVYQEKGGMLPESVELSGGVRLSGSLGTIRAQTAKLNLEQKRFVFSGSVNGSSPPDVQEFRADRLEYESGRLTLEGNVHVATADGTVDAAKAVRDADNKQMTFTGDVAMSSAEGTIRANQAQLDEAKRTMTFSGSVRGDLAEIRGFSAARIVYALDTGDAEITDLRVQRVPMKSKGESGSEDNLMSFSEMAIQRAPQVRVKTKRVESISGGLEFLLRGASQDSPAMSVRAARAGFEYESTDTPLPSIVRLQGGVTVSGTQGNIRADKAELQPATKRFVFSGNVNGDTPDIPQFRAETLSYDAERVTLSGDVEVRHQDGNIRADNAELQPAEKVMRFTGNVHGDAPPVRGLKAEELYFNLTTNEVRITRANIAELTPRAPKPEDAYRLKESDIRDWVQLLALLRRAETDSRPSGARRVLECLPETVRQALQRLPTDRQPNATVQSELVRQFNPILDREDFYDPVSWKNAPLTKEAAELVRQDLSRMDKSDRIRLNRMLFEAAFPGCIAPVATEAKELQR